MKKKLSIRRDKKGLSSLMIAVYVALLTVTLISAIFLGIETASSGVLSSIKNQQDRVQEAIVINGPSGMRLAGSGSSLVEALRVNNTGSTTVRIKALYIDQNFICDPSTFQDTYIPPQENKWINLISATTSQITLNNTILQSEWTVVTEKGVKSTEKAEYILFGYPGEDSGPLRHGFKTGPLLVLFDFFNWRSGSGTWESGWSIPKNTPNVSWRIFVVNVDTRIITFGPHSFFDLIANTNNQGQDQKWFIDLSADQQKTLKPGKGIFIQFTTKVDGTPQAISLNPGVSCLNFLAITGTFNDGSSFGETIPFEAVLITGTPSMTLSASPQAIPVGSSQSTITATMVDDAGNPIPNQLITFTTNLGSLSTHVATTNNAGVATIKLTAGPTSGIATITATATGVTRSTTVTINS